MKLFCYKMIAIIGVAVLMTGCSQKQSISETHYKAGLSSEKEEEAQSMPKIVFDYTFLYDYGESTDMEKIYTFFFIDRYGNVYYGNDQAYFYNSEDREQLYDTLLKNQLCEKTAAVDTEQLLHKYRLLQQMIKEENNVVTIEESTLDVCSGQHKWKGYYYDEDGNLQYAVLYGEGDTHYINSDTKAKEIADWISEWKGEIGDDF